MSYIPTRAAVRHACRPGHMHGLRRPRPAPPPASRAQARQQAWPARVAFVRLRRNRPVDIYIYKQSADHQTISYLPGIRIRTQPAGSGFTTTKLPCQNLDNPTWIVNRHGPTNSGRINKSTSFLACPTRLKVAFIASRAARPSSDTVHERTASDARLAEHVVRVRPVPARQAGGAGGGS